MNSFGSLVADIFRSAATLPLEDANDPENPILKEFRSGKIKKITDKSVLTALEQETDIMTTLTYLNSIGFSYKYDSNILLKIQKFNSQPNYFYYRHLSVFILYNFLSYMILLLENKQKDDIILVASSLIQMIKSDLCSKAFIHLINFYTSNQSNKITKALFRIIVEYFVNIKKLDIDGVMMLTQIANHVLSLETENQAEETKSYFNLIQKIGTSKDIVIEKKWIPILLGSFSSAMYKFDKNALDTFITLVKNRPLEIREDIYPNLPNHVIAAVIDEYKKNHQPQRLPNIPQDNQNQQDQQETNNKSILMQNLSLYPKSNTFLLPPQEELDNLLKMDLMDNSFDYNPDIPENAVYTEKMYLISLSENPEILNYYIGRAALEATNNIDSDYGAVYFAHFVSFLNYINPKSTQTNCVKILLGSFIFDPSITIFNHDEYENFSNLSYIRSEAIKTIINFSFESFFQHILNQINNLDYCIDLLLRLYRYPDFSEIADTFSVKTFSQTLKSFQILAYTNPSQKISIIRYLLIHIFDRCMETVKISKIAFSNRDFCSNYLNMSYETDIRSHIYTNIFKLIKSQINDELKPNQKDPYVLENIILIYSTHLASIQQPKNGENHVDENAHFIIDLLDHLFDIVIRTTFDVTVQKTLSQVLLKPLLLFKSEDNKYGKEIFYKIFRIIPSLRTFEIGKEDKKLLNKFIPIVFKNSLDDELFKSLVKVLIFDRNIDMTHLNIQVPTALSIMYTVFYSNDKMRQKLLDLTIKLCSSSFDNVEKLHQIEIDTFLLKEIMKYKDKEYNKKDEGILYQILNVFVQISSVICSQGIVKHFISLFSPSQTNKISVYEPYFLDALRRLILPSYKKSGVSFYIGEMPKEVTDKSYPAEGFSKCQKGFSIAFWININYLDSRSTAEIFNVKFSDDSWIKISVNNNQILYSQMANNKEPSFVNFETKLNNNEWYFIFIPFLMDDDNYLIQCFLNGNTDPNADKVKRLDLKNSTATINIPNIPHEQNQYSIEISKIFISKVIDYTEIMNFTLQKPNLNLDTSNYLEVFSFPNSPFQYSEQNTQFSNFSEILLKWNLDPLLPLYFVLNMKMINNTYFKDSLWHLTNILSKLLQSNMDIQNQFASSKSIQTISFLISSLKIKIKKEVLTFKLYKAFYQMFFLMTNKQLKKQIFTELIVNFPLWYYCKEFELINIIEYLNNSIFKLQLDSLIKYTTFGRLFISFKNLYDFISESISPNHLSENGQKQIVDNMISILKSVSEFSRALIDYDLIIVTAFESNNDNFTNNLLSLLKSILQFLPPENITYKRLFLLSYILNKENPIFICSIFDIIYKAFSLGLLESQNLEKSFDSILMSLSPKKITTQVINQFIQLSRNQKEYFPIVCWSLITMLPDSSLKSIFVNDFSNKTVQQKQFEFINKIVKIPKSQGYFDTDTKLLWPCLLFLLIGDDNLAYLLMEWLLGFTTWNNIIFTILFISSCLHDKKANRVLNFISLHISNIKKPLKDEDIAFFVYSFIYMFYGYDDSLVYLLDPFSSKNFNQYIDSNLENLTSNGIYEKVLANIKQLHFLFKFDPIKEDDIAPTKESIDFRKLYKWSFLPLAKTIIIQFSLCQNIETLKDMELVLVYVIHQFDSGWIKSHKHLDQIYQANFSKDPKKSNGFNNISQILENFYKQYISNEYQSYINSLIGSLREIINFSHTEVEDIAKSNIQKEEFTQKINNELEAKNIESKRDWSLLWSSLSITGGPWDSDFFSSGAEEKHYIRASTSCPSGHYPFLMKINKHFVQHMSFEESLVDADPNSSSSTKSIKEEVPQDNEQDVLDITLQNETSERLYKQEERNKTKANNIILNYYCEVIKPSKTIKAAFYLCKDYISIQSDRKIKTIQLSSIGEIHFRTRKHIQTAIEIFTTYSSIFIDFAVNAPKKPIPIILSKIQQALNYVQYNSLVYFPKNNIFWKEFNTFQYTEQWAQGKISTFKYLMHLNTFSGRSFNDVSQYPIFPWILQNYSTETLDIHDESIYRDLSKPIGALNEERLQQLTENLAISEYDGESYLYSSGPMSPLSVCVYLLRIEPFATCHIQLQGGHFDNPSRLFTSFQDTFQILKGLSHDYWEMVPEFFFLPEALINENHFILGNEANPVDSVILPPWAKSNPIEFIYLHRKLLEGNYVSNNINNWIDLVWGYKQKGEEALKANNLFLPSLYDDIWNKDVDESEYDLINHYLLLTGQIPPQLFTSKHPQRHFTSLPELSKFSFETNVTNIIAGDMKEKDPKTIKFYLLLQDGKIVHVKYNPTTNQITKNKMIYDLKTTILNTSNPVNKHILIHSKNEQNLISYIDLSHKISNPKVFNMEESKISTICLPNDKKFCIGTIDSSTEIHSLYSNDDPIRVKCYRDSITCTAANSDFDILVNGTKDGALFVISLSTGKTIRVIDIGDVEVLCVNITPSWGFIVVSFKVNELYFIAVYTINGKFIRKKEVSGKISIIESWSSPRDFDFIAFVIEPRKLYLCEAFYLNFDTSNQLQFLSTNIIMVRYSKESSRLFVVSANGNIQAIECRTKDLEIIFPT